MGLERKIMKEDRTVEILKNAILLEKRGQVFYSKIAQQTSGKAVKAFFELMADEEVKHVEILADQFKAYRQNEKFNPGQYQENHEPSISAKVLTKELKEEISAADYEAAAISAAMAMEKNAIKLYSDRASDAADPNEKALYQWLADWEQQHLIFLAEIDKELTEKVWYDNNFWPF
jgi:rubrerythrin